MKEPPQIKSSHLLYLNDYKIDSYIGVYDNEKSQTQRLVISVEAEIGLLSDHDDILHTFNYENIKTVIDRVANSGHILIIETLANRIAKELLTYDIVHRARVNVAKPYALENIEKVGVVAQYSKVYNGD